MSAIVRFLSGLSGYPIPQATLENIALSAGLNTKVALNHETLQSKECKRAKAHVYLWLSTAPNVSQGGISYSFTADERNRLHNRAMGLLEEIGEADGLDLALGYVGEDL